MTQRRLKLSFLETTHFLMHQLRDFIESHSDSEFQTEKILERKEVSASCP